MKESENICERCGCVIDNITFVVCKKCGEETHWTKVPPLNPPTKDLEV